jgi:hypothetical protein
LPHSFLDGVEVRTLTADSVERDADVNATLVELRRLSQEVIDEYQKNAAPGRANDPQMGLLQPRFSEAS